MTENTASCPAACFGPATILLPAADIPLGQWACIACDQFTSDPEYWAAARQAAAGGPSTLDLILPEAFLGTAGQDARIATIHQAMRRYADTVLTRQVQGFVYVERTLASGRVRQGLVGAIDLEAYSYDPEAQPAIRPSEATVVERIPPRLAVRQGACLESPHVMMLADDPACTLIEPVAAQKDRLPLVYEGDLMLEGGHIAGWAVEDPALVASIQGAVAALGSRETNAARWPEAADRAPLTLAVGDGNHSLATAKAYWEARRQTLTEAQRAADPARWCLVEVCNIQSPAIEIEPIHRVFFGAELESVLLSLTAYSDMHGLGLRTGADGSQPICLLDGTHRVPLCFDRPAAPLAVGTVEAFTAHYLADHEGVRVDYIHDTAALEALCRKGAVGIQLPPFAKSDLFRGVVLGGVLPRKSFSMGHARDKRYYLECRRIAD